METTTMTDEVITRKALLEHWQGHRALTRRVIEAFPEDQLFTFSIGGMRPFGQLVLEMLDIAGPGLDGMVTRTWTALDTSHRSGMNTKQELLDAWDKTTAHINAQWSLIPEGRFQEMDKAFGQYEGQIYSTFLYFVDNEIHHRGQGYVYLRALGIQPPFFWER